MASTATRRKHLKSRNGCLQCKNRKIKCDENGLSTCAQCAKGRLSCSFAPPAPLPNQGLSSTALLDMELLHSFTINTAKSISDVSEIQTFFSTTFVQLALKHDFLLHCILALSAFHIVSPQGTAQSSPSIDMGRTTDQYLLAAYNHHERALKGYRCSLSSLNSESCHPIFGCACLLFITSFSRPSKNPFPSNQPDISMGTGIWLDFQLAEWIILIKGLPSIVNQSELLPVLRQGPMSPLIKARESIYTKDNCDPGKNVLAYSRLRDLSEALGKQSSDQHAVEICQSSLRTLHEVVGELSQRHDTALAFIWPMRVNPDYLILLEDKRPEALLVFAYYCALLHLMSSRWFTKAWPRSILESIRDSIEEQWIWLLNWPLETVLDGQEPSWEDSKNK